MSADHLIVLPLGGELLAFTRAELDAARARARDLGLDANNSATQVEALVDSARMAEIAGVPRSWIEEAARQKRIPSVEAGKYVRYRPSAVLAALTNTTNETAGVTHHDHHASRRRNGRKSPS
jgi:hypothetical protein